MNKARAMLDALMGPGRDELPKDEEKAKEKFKDRTVCKGFLIGLCPLDASCLGGKRTFPVCSKIHSDIMREQMKNHPDCATLTRDYEHLSLQDLEHVVRECEAHISQEKQRIRTDVRRKKPPLPLAVNDRLSHMKREANNMLEQAEKLDDDRIREKENLIAKANEMLKDREDMLELETKKAAEALDPELVCDVCGTSYVGEDGNAAHMKFRIHEAYTQVRDRIKELKPRVEEWEKQKRDKKEEEFKKKRKEEWDKAQEKEKQNGEKKSRERSNDKDKERGKDNDKERDKDKDEDKDKDRARRRGRTRSRSKGRDRSRKQKTKSPSRGKRRSMSGKKRVASSKRETQSPSRAHDRERGKSRRVGESRSRSRRRRR